MNGSYQWKCIGRVIGLIGISAVLAACDGSNSSTASNVGSASDTAATEAAADVRAPRPFMGFTFGGTRTTSTVASNATSGSTSSTTAHTPISTNSTGSNTAASSSTTATSGTTASSSTPSSTSGSGGTTPPATSDTVTLSWTAPDENTNGTALTNLAGYQINYGTSPTALTQQISINTVGVTNYVVSNLSSGTWYFEIVAVNSAGLQSGPSSVVSTTI